MPGGRKTTPLFDLLTKRQSAATPVAPDPRDPEMRSSKPIVRVELKPREVLDDLPSEREGPTWSGTVSKARPTTHHKYLIIAGVALLVVTAWVVGWKLGQTKKETELEPMLRRPEPGVREPGVDRSSDVSAYTPPPDGARGKVAQAATDPQTPNLAVDRREKGLNYLYLAVLSQSEAEKAGQFLKKNGVDAYAVGWVDPKGGNANNGDPLYRLFVLPGVTGPELRQTVAQNLQAKVIQLGNTWQKDHHGSSNFAKYSWEKFQ